MRGNAAPVKMTEAERFFYYHAGYSYDPQTTTRNQGRRDTARALAEAKSYAQKMGFSFRWEWDDQPWDGDGEAPAEVLGCICNTPSEKHIASLWGIGDPDRDYRRVIEAELALEAKDSILNSVLEAI